jgi:TetR/AcrR family fatty acid metabolism transcriptional regulator
MICLRKSSNSMNNNSRNKDKYHRILDAAVSVFADQGFYNSTISQIAREAGVADGTIYLYFKNKQDILSQFFTYKTRLVFSNFKQAVDKEKNAIDKLRCLIKIHFQEFQRDRKMAEVYRMETRQSHQLMEQQIKEMTKMYLDLIASIVEQGQEEATMRQDLFLALVKRFILGAVEEVINVWVISGGKYDLVSQADPLVDLFLKGIGENGFTQSEDQ